MTVAVCFICFVLTLAAKTFYCALCCEPRGAGLSDEAYLGSVFLIGWEILTVLYTCVVTRTVIVQTSKNKTTNLSFKLPATVRVSLSKTLTPTGLPLCVSVFAVPGVHQSVFQGAAGALFQFCVSRPTCRGVVVRTSRLARRHRAPSPPSVCPLGGRD